MLTVTNGNQTELLLESNYEKTLELNGAPQISFSSFLTLQNVGHNLLDYEVLIEDEDGHEYKVKQYKQHGKEKQIVATHIFYELVHEWKYGIYGGTRSLDDFASWVLDGTGWTFINDGVSEYKLIPNFGEGNVITLINALISAFECEFEVLPNKQIRFAKVIGQDNDLQYRYRHNLTDLVQSVDTTNLKTKIRGYGANGLMVEYTSPLANHPRIGIREAEPIYDDRFTHFDSLLEYLKSQLPDEPETVIEVSVTEVDGEIGDVVWVIHEELNIEYQTRILSKKVKRNYADSTVVVGNTKPKDVTDILISQKVEIDENRKEYRSKFEQTNEKITLEVERIDGELTENRTLIEQTADNILIKAESTDQENGDKLVGLINVSSENVLIQAKNVDLVGQVNFSMLANDVKDELDSKVSGWELGDLAYEDLVEKAKLGTTVIQGGYIRSELLTADNIVTGTLSADRIWGGTLSGVTINVSTDAHIGDVLYLNGNNFGNGIMWGPGWSSPKIYTDPISRAIIVSDYKVTLSGRAEIGAYNGSGDLIGFHVNAIGKRLAVYANGSYVGYIDIN